MSNSIQSRLSNPSLGAEQIFADSGFPIDIVYLIEFFEFLISAPEREENGVVFTPKYIADYIVSDVLAGIKDWDNNIRIIEKMMSD